MNDPPLEDANAPSLEAVERMTDDCGMLQHSRLVVPDRVHGYCLDDNARALMLTAEFEGEDRETDRARKLAVTYAAFVRYAWKDDIARFRNLMAFDRSWLEREGSQDSFGRTLWALGRVAAFGRDHGLRLWAADLAERAFRASDFLTRPRAQAFAILGFAAYREGKAEHWAARDSLELFGGRLLELLRSNRRAGWIWFERALAYENARLPEALLRTGIALRRSDMQDEALAALDWLMSKQTTPEGHFRPIGNEGFGEICSAPRLFDQQPVEAWATIDACALAYQTTKHTRWVAESEKAYAWYLGGNDIGLPVAASDGGCFDGLRREGVNDNQGAESILALQLSRLAIQRLRATVSGPTDRPSSTQDASKPKDPH